MKAINSMIKIMVLLGIAVILCACGTDAAKSNEKITQTEIRNQCKIEYNKAGNPCQVSVYEIIASPKTWSGMHVEFMAYAPADGVRLVFINRDASEFEDYQSSFLIMGGGEEQIKREGYVLVRAKFESDRDDYGIASGTRSQIGILSELTVRRQVTSMSQRREDCAKDDCFVRHLDGKRSAE